MNKNLKLYFVVAAMLTALASTSTRAQGREQSHLARFDKDGDKKLNAEERKAALRSLDRVFAIHSME